MTFTLNRKKLYWIGIFILSFYYVLNKIEFIRQAEFAKGVVTPVGYIQFQVDAEKYFFTGIKNLEYQTGEQLSVVYSKEKPDQAYVFSFMGFWYEGLIFTLIPIAVWSAYVLAFVDDEKKLYCSLWEHGKPNQFNYRKRELKE